MHRRQPPMVRPVLALECLSDPNVVNEMFQQIDEALRSHCGIAAKQYFVAAISEDGKPITFFSPGQKLNDMAIRQFFDMTKFQQVIARVDAGKTSAHHDLYLGLILTTSCLGSRRRSHIG